MLTLEQQLEVQNGDLKPVAVSKNIVELTQAASINYAIEFTSSHKVFDELDVNGDPINEKASAYLSKMLSICNRSITADYKAIKSLANVISSKISQLETPNITPELIEGASAANWEQFIINKMPSAFELFANIRLDEKQEYNSLP